MRKIFIFALAAMIIFALPFTASATTSESDSSLSFDTDDMQPQFTNYLKDAVFTVSCYDQDANLIEKRVTADPFITLSTGAYYIYFDWTPSVYTYCNHLFMSYQRYNNNPMQLYINDSVLLSANNSGADKPTNYYYAAYQYIYQMRVVFKSDSPMYRVGIIQALGVPIDEFTVSSGTYSIDASVAVYAGSDQWIVETATVQPFTSTNFDISSFWTSSSLGYTVLSSRVNFVIPIDPLQSDQIDYFRFLFSCYDSLPDVSAYISSSSDPVYSLGADASSSADLNALNVKLTEFQTDIIPPDEVFAVPLTGFEAKIDTSNLNLRKKYLHVSIYFPGVDNDVNYEVVCAFNCKGVTYYHDLTTESSIFARISVYLCELREELSAVGFSADQIYLELNDIYDLLVDFMENYEQPDYSSALDSLLQITSGNSALLQSILDSINNQPDYEQYLVSLLASLGSVINSTSSIYDWLVNFSPDSGSDLNISIGNAHQSSEELHDQLQVLETTPRLSVDQMQDVLQYVDSVGSEVSGDVNVDPGDDDGWLSEPVTLTTPLGYIFNGSSDMSALIGQMLLLVTSLALIGYVLFGKR